MNKTDAINMVLPELDTFYNKGSYGGPVVHYWKNSFPYSGFGVDWRYEGIMRAFITLHRKTSNNYFIQRLRECGDFIVQNKRAHGGFRNCGFENNPSFERGFMPHEASVIIALLELSSYFREKKLEWEKYYFAAKQGVDNYLIPNFWNPKEKAFIQYEARLGHANNIFVPNKMATMSEALFILSKMSGNGKYLKYGSLNMEKSTSISGEDGASFQSDANAKKIVFYNAREVPALLMYGYKEIAGQKAEFVEKHWSNGFDFCEVEGRTMRFPVFVAGSGTILKALHLTGRMDKKYESYLLGNLRQNGSIPSFSGLLEKDSFANMARSSVTDMFSAVGWMDKSLEYLAMSVEDYAYENFEIPTIKRKCSDGTYIEGHQTISANGKTYPKKYEPQRISFDSSVGSRENIFSRALYFFYRKTSSFIGGNSGT